MLKNRKNRHFLSSGLKKVIFWHFIDDNRSNYRLLGSNLGVIFIIYRIMTQNKCGRGGDHPYGFFGTHKRVFWTRWGPKLHPRVDFQHVILCFNVVPHTFWANTSHMRVYQDFSPPGYMWKTIFRFFGHFQRGRTGPKTLLICVFGEFSEFFSKIKIWIFMLTNFILVSIG